MTLFETFIKQYEANFANISGFPSGQNRRKSSL